MVENMSKQLDDDRKLECRKEMVFRKDTWVISG